MGKFTQEQKQAYFADLRARWKLAKQLLTESKIKDIDAMIATHGLNIYRMGFMVVSMQMSAQNLDGLPYLDAKTFKGWQENGFQVKKGEKSTLGSITWIGVQGKEAKQGEDAKDGYVMPKAYKLFHRSQVEAA